MFVLTLIARQAHSLDGLLDKLNSYQPVIPAVFTYEDEIQLAFDSADSLLAATMMAAAGGRVWVGIGVGSLDSAEAGLSGPALMSSRAAVESARTGSPVRGISVVGAPSQQAVAEQVTGILRLMYRVVAERSEIEQRVVELIVPGVRGQLKSIAQVLGVSPQAVSKTLTRTKWHEERACYPAVVALLQALDSVYL